MAAVGRLQHEARHLGGLEGQENLGHVQLVGRDDPGEQAQTVDQAHQPARSSGHCDYVSVCFIVLLGDFLSSMYICRQEENNATLIYYSNKKCKHTSAEE